MQYFLSDQELKRFTDALKASIANPFIDGIEDYILEAIWEYAKDIDGIDPFYNTRSKKLYDVVDTKNHIGWSVKSLQKNFHDGCESGLVIQRADVYDKAEALGFETLDSNSDPDRIGAALLKHWQIKVNADAIDQDVTSKRMIVLLKTSDKHRYCIFEEDIAQYSPADLYWKWTDSKKKGLKGYRRSDNMCVYRWYVSQKHLFERFVLPDEVQHIDLTPVRLSKDQIINTILPLLKEQK